MDSEDDEIGLFRTDGFWYVNAFNILNEFVNKLKIELAFEKRDIPFDIESKVLAIMEKKNWKSMPEQIRLLNEYNKFINLELRTRLDKLGVQYDETDIYINVVIYAKMKGINIDDDKILRNEVCPWLGITDWNSNTGGRTVQLKKLKRTIKKMNGGNKLNKKRSRSLRRSRNLKKSNRKKNILTVR
jgi:hypothetical protein